MSKKWTIDGDFSFILTLRQHEILKENKTIKNVENKIKRIEIDTEVIISKDKVQEKEQEMKEEEEAETDLSINKKNNNKKREEDNLEVKDKFK